MTDGMDIFSIQELMDFSKFCEEMFLNYDNGAWWEAKTHTDMVIRVRIKAIGPHAPSD